MSVVLPGLPLAPGTARGPVHLGPQGVTRAHLAVLTDAEIGALDARPAGLVLREAAPFSHRVIRLLSLGVPCLLLDEPEAAGLVEGAEALLDATAGRLVVPAPPDPGPRPGPTPANARATAPGGHAAVELRASVGSVAAAATARAGGASAIGLVRSELLVPPDGSEPDAAFFEAAFGALCEAAHPLAVTIRLLDLAPDKRPAWWPEAASPSRALGLHGPRLYRVEAARRVLEAELRAVRTLAPRHPLRLLVPALTLPEEFAGLRRWIESRVGPRVPLGAMLESPAAVLMAPEFLEAADFVSVGCNDLMQFLFAADRDRPETAYLLSPYAPAVYRLLRWLAEAAGERTRSLQLCGLLPQLPGVMAVLMGLGYRAFSVEPALLPHLARTVVATDPGAAQALARAVCAAQTAREVRALLQAGDPALAHARG